MNEPFDLDRFEPHDPVFQADPYPSYAALRALAPVRRFQSVRAGFSFYWVSRYEEVCAILRDPRFSAEKVPGEMLAPGVPDSFRRLGELLIRMMLVRDPPHHTRLRGLVNKAFTPRVVEGLRERVEQIVAGLFDAVQPRGGMDVIRDLATPLPVMVIAELLGIPASDRDRLKHWSDRIAVVLDGSLLAAGLPAAAGAAGELADFLHGVVAERRAAPRDDLLSRLCAARDREDALTEDELIATAILILLAGHETTTNLIGNGTLALAEHPGALERLRREPGLLPGAVEEMLRYDPPVQVTSRAAREPVAIAGVRIEPGIEVDLSLASANRDAGAFREAERFDVARDPNRHLSFGLGAHFCLGAPLARLEAQVAFEALLRRVPGFKLERAGIRRKPGLVLRGVESLPISF